jgi:hypothetical protein
MHEDDGMKIVWQVRRKIVNLLSVAPPEKRAALRTALRGVDQLLRTNFDCRRGGRWNVKNN